MEIEKSKADAHNSTDERWPLVYLNIRTGQFSQLKDVFGLLYEGEGHPVD